MKKLAIITTHPVQYNAPVFKLITDRQKIKIKVFYTWGDRVLQKKYDPGFARDIQWDIPLLDGYEYEWVENIASDPGSHHFFGINTPNLNQSINNWGADAILIYGWNFMGHLSAMRFFKGKIPVFFRGDSTLLGRDTNSFKEKLKYYFLRWIFSYIDKSFFVGKENKKYFLRYGFRENQLIFAPHAVDNNRFLKEVYNDYRIELSIPEHAIVFLYAGKFEAVKNLFFLLDTFSLTNNEDTFLLLAGTGKLETDLRKKVSSFDYKVKNRIRFCGFVNQQKMPDLYSICDVFILPSLSETWGLSVNEAMASGKAVLISDHCGCASDLVLNEKNGYVFSIENHEDLLNKINLIKNRRQAKWMGCESLNIIKSSNFNEFADALESELNNENR